MTFYGNDVKYKGFYDGVKSIVLQRQHLLIQFDNGKIISYDICDIPKVLFDKNK